MLQSSFYYCVRKISDPRGRTARKTAQGLSFIVHRQDKPFEISSKANGKKWMQQTAVRVGMGDKQQYEVSPQRDKR